MHLVKVAAEMSNHLPFEMYYIVGVAHSVQCLTTNWMTGVRSPTEAEDFLSSLCIQTGSGAHPASRPVGTEGSFSRGKARLQCDADHSPHLVPRLSMSRSTASLHMRLHGM
jgi:hypothetical protein